MDPFDPKLQALIDNYLGRARGGHDSLSELLGFRWEPAPEGFVCPHCAGALERSASLMQMSPWAGSVRCTACGYRHTVCGYLGQLMIQVQPMPPGAALIYDRDPDVVDAILSEEPPVTGE